VFENDYIVNLKIYSKLFNKDIEVCLYPIDENPEKITDNMVEGVNDFLNLSEEHLPKIKELLFSQCEMCFDSASYGVEVLDNETETEATKRSFGIYNKDDAYKKSYIDRISIDAKNDTYDNRYVEIVFIPEWEDEHGCIIILQNGVPIDWQGSLLWMGHYEKE